MPSPRQPAKGKACKRTNGFCTQTASNQKKKAARSPVFPRFPHSREILCGKKFASLRQERNFFQQRNPVFAARKRPPGRRNVPYGQFPRPFFNTSPPISALPPRRMDAESGGKLSFLMGNHVIWRHFGKLPETTAPPFIPQIPAHPHVVRVQLVTRFRFVHFK